MNIQNIRVTTAISILAVIAVLSMAAIIYLPIFQPENYIKNGIKQEIKGNEKENEIKQETKGNEKEIELSTEQNFSSNKRKVEYDKIIEENKEIKEERKEIFKILKKIDEDKTLTSSLINKEDLLEERRAALKNLSK